ncbi:MAG: tRNA 2-thiouridine(34) synthase MnmA [Fretibacterium sp.]|nr:tRNA 2-thiouridine(34) synthase MnmA [Fretibacterium sp.]
MGKGVLAAMSGGVDSSVAACLLKEQGYACTGATMRLFLNGDIGLSAHRPCCSRREIDDAAAVAGLLGIPHEVIDCTVDFKLRVIDKFIRVYESGGTPNPCIDCNRFLKFGALLAAARERGLDFIATGHYARIERAASGRYLLKKAADRERDQSYVLYSLTQEQLAHALFPLGEMTKAEVRALAEAHGFANARKQDSQDICFVPDGNYAGFIEQYTGRTSPPGDFISPEGKVLGRHRGILRYTLGQRRGLGIPAETRLYVSAIDPASNTVTLSREEALFVRTVQAEDVSLIAVPSLEGPVRVSAKVRYRQQEAPATAVRTDGGGLLVTFDDPLRAPAAGQALVLYDGDTVLGGGTISGAF